MEMGPTVPPVDFYPRSPRGERQNGANQFGITDKFLSTLPARGATGGSNGNFTRKSHFYPRSPRGERQQMC